MELKQLKDALNKLGVEIVAEVIDELTKNDSRATGDLVNSISYEVLETSDALMLNILSNDYFKYIDEGRRPGRKQPPTSAILPWVEAKGITFRTNGGKILSSESTAFLIARSIGIKGIKPLHIKDKVISSILNTRLDYIKAGFKLDIQDYVNKNIFNS